MQAWAGKFDSDDLPFLTLQDSAAFYTRRQEAQSQEPEMVFDLGETD